MNSPAPLADGEIRHLIQGNIFTSGRLKWGRPGG